MKEYLIKPVAVIKNGYNEKFGVPRQSGLAENIKSEIVFEHDFRDENLIRDIEQYSHLWLIWGFSRNEGEWSPTVRPPKLGGNKRVGVFATRSPFRPNSLGLTVVKLEEVRSTAKGKVLVVSGADLVNDTPIFDIKPYLPYVDAIPNAVGGFADEHSNEILKVSASGEVEAAVSKELLSEITSILALDPKPSYQMDTERIYKMSYKNFNIEFKYLSEKEIVIIGVKGE